MKIKEYIESGILEAYVLGSVSEEEAREVLQLKKQYSEIQDALYELETDLERLAHYMAIPPPPDLWAKIEDNINELTTTPDYEPLRFKKYRENRSGKTTNNGQYIELEAENTHMRVNKTWKWVFIAVFILSKIFLISAIYFYLENRQAQQQIQQLKTELKQSHTP